jgi:N-acetylglucosamine-6-phosphate deacetylase
MTNITGRRYDTAEAIEIQIENDRIAAVSNIPSNDNLPWIAPGFIDLQVNGFRGVGFNDGELTSDGIQQVCDDMARFGVARFLPTCTTDSHEQLRRSLAAIARAIESSPRLAAAMPGIHLEGPFISPDDGPRGAHPREHVRPPDWNEFQRLQDAAGGRIKLLTLSPEYENAPRLIEQVVAEGVVVAIGHTKATTEQIRAAVDAGARLSTHLGNGAHPLLRRHPNYIWDQLAEDRLFASLIVDGHHLPATVVKTMVRAKSPERCILVSDTTSLGGLSPGRYSTSLGDVEMLDDGRLVVAGQRDILAGASLPLPVNIARVMPFAEIGLQTAVEMATVNPARLMSWDVPFLAIGDRLNLVQFDLLGEPGEERIEVHSLDRG